MSTPSTPGGYAPPPGYAPPAGYLPPAGPAHGAGWAPSQPKPARGVALGLTAFLLALGAAVLAPAAGGIGGYFIGAGTGERLMAGTLGTDFDWSLLSPVRDWVLLAEIGFWAGTVLGLWAIVQGIIAIARRAGRGWGIAAVVVAALGPVVFGLTLQAVIVAGLAAAAS
ncbi:hypothetical protein QSU92_02045 [Microbacterium sp. ET2]|uniref:hypothetical protein n=1 Tax=Microbacterium albipurpureum TaxID=3050384 RepID=UPI00259D18C2|nr:hypothetical protein [Microbacterium sp. ET2 (Ac-2212)]WJL96014.1 hypothetical protein QSU92_02045 [Microbacterium sp. ET2 (Ac-2212)]